MERPRRDPVLAENTDGLDPAFLRLVTAAVIVVLPFIDEIRLDRQVLDRPVLPIKSIPLFGRRRQGNRALVFIENRQPDIVARIIQINKIDRVLAVEIPARLDRVEIERARAVAGSAVADQEILALPANKILAADPEAHRDISGPFHVKIEVIEYDLIRVPVAVVAVILISASRPQKIITLELVGQFSE